MHLECPLLWPLLETLFGFGFASQTIPVDVATAFGIDLVTILNEEIARRGACTCVSACCCG